MAPGLLSERHCSLLIYSHMLNPGSKIVNRILIFLSHLYNSTGEVPVSFRSEWRSQSAKYRLRDIKN